MYLYNKENNTIEVYSVYYNYNELLKFRREEIQKIPSDKRFFYAITNYKAILENPTETIKWSNLDYYESYYGGKSYHSVYNYNIDQEEKTRQENLLDNYYYDCYSSSPIVKVIIDNNSKKLYDIEEDFRYFILTKTEYEPQMFPNGSYILPDILSVTKPLYILQLFEKGQFKRLKDEDISCLSTLFQVSKEPVKIIPIKYLSNLDSLGIYGEYNETMAKVEETQKILQKIRETSKSYTTK